MRLRQKGQQFPTSDCESFFRDCCFICCWHDIQRLPVTASFTNTSCHDLNTFIHMSRCAMGASLLSSNFFSLLPIQSSFVYPPTTLSSSTPNISLFSSLYCGTFKHNSPCLSLPNPAPSKPPRTSILTSPQWKPSSSPSATTTSPFLKP